MKKNFLLRRSGFPGLLWIALLVGTAIVLWVMKPSIKPDSPMVTAWTERSEADPELRWREEFDMLKNPATGQIPKGIRRAELLQAATMPLKEREVLLAANDYQFAGPNNIGGRCRALAYDIRFNGTSNRVMLAGGVSSGMFRSTNGGESWTRVSSLSDIHNVTSLVQDPRPGFQDTWYFGTGESIGNSASATGSTYWGYGIWKSTDNGLTWNPLASTQAGSQFSFDNRFDYVSRLAIDPATGELYAATLNTIMRSADGGATWSTELGVFGGTTAGITDVHISGDRVVFAAIPGRGGASVDNEGIWRKQNGTWSRIAGGGSPAWFNTGANLGRIVLTTAPNNPTTLYALYFNGITYDCNDPKPEAEFGRWDNKTESWTDLSANLPDEPGCLTGNDPFAVQGGYDLVVAVKPDDPSVVFLGGTNAYRSTDGFTSAANTTRIGGYNSAANYVFYPNSHPDIHAFGFRPDNPNIMLCGTDGGVSEADIRPLQVSWTDRNTDFTTMQFYYVAIDPTAGSDRYIGGSQDNGTSYRDPGVNSHMMVFGGDGVSVGISSGNTSHYVGSQRGNAVRRAPGLAPNFINARLAPDEANRHPNRLFVTLFHLDPDNTTVFYYADFNKLLRNNRADTVTLNAVSADRLEEFINVAPEMGNVSIRSIATSRAQLYDPATARLYFGTNDGRIYRLNAPINQATTAAFTRINEGAGMPTGTIIGLAANPANSDEIMAVYSNYGIVNIWHCANTQAPNPVWTAIEGNLTLPSVRSCAIVRNGDQTEYYVGTSTGLYSTTALNGNGTIWLKEGAGTIGNAVVVDLKLRISDNTLLVGTHGNGMFVTRVAALPVQFGNLTGQLINGKARLQWRTFSEVNNQGFEVQRSGDGIHFRKTGFVQGAGNSTSQRSYQFADSEPNGSVQYYRLKQLDYDGRFGYSNTIKLTQADAALEIVRLVNPAGSSLVFTLNEAPRGPLSLVLTDAAGRIVMRQTIAAGSSNVVNVNIARLANDAYTLQVTGQGLSESRRIIKQM